MKMKNFRFELSYFIIAYHEMDKLSLILNFKNKYKK